MITATRNDQAPFELRLINHATDKVNTYYLDPNTTLKELLSDAIDLDLALAFADGQQRSLVITANPPQRRH